MRPANSTIRSLRELKGDNSYRELADQLGYDLSAIGFLNDLLRKKLTPSLEKENDLRRRLGLGPITESGYPVRTKKLDRPYATEDQIARKNAMLLDWKLIIDLGLSSWEAYFDDWPHVEGWGNVEHFPDFPVPPPGWKESRQLPDEDEEEIEG